MNSYWIQTVQYISHKGSQRVTKGLALRGRALPVWIDLKVKRGGLGPYSGKHKARNQKAACGLDSQRGQRWGRQDCVWRGGSHGDKDVPNIQGTRE